MQRSARASAGKVRKRNEIADPDRVEAERFAGELTKMVLKGVRRRSWNLERASERTECDVCVSVFVACALLKETPIISQQPERLWVKAHAHAACEENLLQQRKERVACVCVCVCCASRLRKSRSGARKDMLSSLHAIQYPDLALPPTRPCDQED